MSTRSSIYRQESEDFSEELHIFYEPGINYEKDGIYVYARRDGADVLVFVEDPLQLIARLSEELLSREKR